MNKDELLYYYFSNSLTKEQELIFNKLLKEDEEFKKQFEFETNLKRVANEAHRITLKSKLNQYEADIKSKKTKLNDWFTYLKIAASIILLVTAGWLTYQNFYKIDYNNLYSENYEPYPNTVYSVTRSDSINSIERKAFVAYEAGRYNLAIDMFEEADQKDYFDFYKAQSYLKLSKYNDARRLFEEVAKTNKEFVAESYWYIALIYLKEENKEKALYYLEQLISNYDYKKDNVQRLIDELN